MNISTSVPDTNSITQQHNQPVTSKMGMTSNIPRIPLDLRAHKLAIAIPWIIIVSTGGIIPLIGYFALKYTIDPSTTVVLSPWLATFGASSLYNLFFRLWSLAKKSSTCRPMGSSSAWTLDFFQWNFMICFVGITVLISVAIALQQVRVASIPLAVLMAYVCGLLLLAPLAKALGLRTPCRISSTARGEPVKAGVLAIVEDIVAVDAKQGTELRHLLHERYEASLPMRTLFHRLDLLWGISGVCVAAGIVAVIFAVSEESVGYGVGKYCGLPG